LVSAIGLTVIMFIAAAMSEIFSRDDILPPELARKIFHVIAGVSTAYSIKLINDKNILIVFGIGAIVVTALLLIFDVFKSIRQTRKQSWGSFYLSVSYVIVVLLLFPNYKEIIFIVLLIFAIADSTAAITGSLFAKWFYKLTSDEKSVIGSSLFFISSASLIFLYHSYFLPVNSTPILFSTFLNSIILSLTIALILTATEAISSKGTDNLFVPLFGAVLLYVFWNTAQAELVGQFVLGVFLSALIAFLSIRFKFLTPNGSVATFILASFIFGLGGWKWAIPIITFFILSSFLSKVRKKENAKIDTYFEKTGTRDYLQVLANGGLGGLLVVYNQIFPNEVNYYIYLASLSAVCADTWATEIGTLRKRVTYNVLTFKKIEQGMSGGISWIGTLGALLGSFVIALSGLFWIDLHFVSYILLIVLAGLFGSFFDSILGATIQAQGKCNVCEKITEKNIHCGVSTTHYRGLKWLNNDAVNFLAGISSAGLILLINYIN